MSKVQDCGGRAGKRSPSGRTLEKKIKRTDYPSGVVLDVSIEPNKSFDAPKK
jgi:hypothetical protein